MLKNTHAVNVDSAAPDTPSRVFGRMTVKRSQTTLKISDIPKRK